MTWKDASRRWLTWLLVPSSLLVILIMTGLIMRDPCSAPCQPRLHPSVSSEVQPDASGVIPMLFLWEGFKMTVSAKKGLVRFGAGRDCPRVACQQPVLLLPTQSSQVVRGGRGKDKPFPRSPSRTNLCLSTLPSSFSHVEWQAFPAHQLTAHSARAAARQNGDRPHLCAL